MSGLLRSLGDWLTWYTTHKMNNIKDNIKIVDGDKQTLRRAKLRITMQKLKRFLANVKWRILVILNGFKF